MKPQTQDEAASRFCPFTFGDQRGASTCLAGRCMAWRVVHAQHRREDHSGAREHLMEQGVKTGRTARREGGPMSSGFWVLDEVGVCARLDQTSA
jgi:hypothetical protein